MLLNKANINTNHALHKPSTPIEIKEAVAIWLEKEEVYADERRLYINLTEMNDKNEEYDEEMRNAAEDLNTEEAQRKGDYHARKSTRMKPRSQGNVNENEWKGLEYSRTRNIPRNNEKNENNRIMTTRTEYLNYKHDIWISQQPLRTTNNKNITTAKIKGKFREFSLSTTMIITHSWYNRMRGTAFHHNMTKFQTKVKKKLSKQDIIRRTHTIKMKVRY